MITTNQALRASLFTFITLYPTRPALFPIQGKGTKSMSNTRSWNTIKFRYKALGLSLFKRSFWWACCWREFALRRWFGLYLEGILRLKMCVQGGGIELPCKHRCPLKYKHGIRNAIRTARRCFYFSQQKKSLNAQQIISTCNATFVAQQVAGKCSPYYLA